MPVFTPLVGRRVAALPVALDGLDRPHVRLAPDEALVFGEAPVTLPDEHAIDLLDGGWHVAEMAESQVLESLALLTDWPVDAVRPQLLQGLAAGVPVKVLVRGDGTATVVVASPYVHEIQERWR